MYSIFDILELLNAYSSIISSMIGDILFAAALVYVIYYVILLVKDNLMRHEADNYVNGELDDDLTESDDTSTRSTTSREAESELDDSFDLDLQQSIDFEDLMTDDDSNIYYSRGVIPVGYMGHAHDEAQQSFVATTNESDDDKVHSILAGGGDTNSSPEDPNYSHVSLESGDGIYPLDDLSDAEPIAHSSPLRNSGDESRNE